MKRKGGCLQKKVAILLSAVLLVGTVANMFPVSAWAQEENEAQESAGGNTAEAAEGGITPEEGSGTEDQMNPETGSMEDADAATVQKRPEPGTEGETEPGTVSGNDEETEPAAAPQSMMRAAPAVQAGSIASGDGWTLDSDGKLTVSSDTEGVEWLQYRDDIKSVEIQSGVTSIPNSMFNNCRNLRSIEMPDSVTSIGNAAFIGCSSLTGITIPDGVTSIGNQMFHDCSSLTSITIPDSVESIGQSAFQGCSSLTSITIPDSVESIGQRAFQNCTGLTGIMLSANLKSIGQSAFQDCTGLTGITLPDSLERIGDGAFRRCRSLQNITIGTNVTSIESWAFSECSALEKVTMQSQTPPTAGRDIFNGCQCVSGSMKGIHVPEGTMSVYQRTEGWSTYEEHITDGTHIHTMISVAAQSPTCAEDGNEAYYTCSGCDKWFSDAAGTQEITDKNSVVISKTEHSYNSEWEYRGPDGHAHKCQNCGAHDTVSAHTPGAAATETTPQTCTACGYEIDPIIGHIHAYGEWIVDREATETEAGERHRVCSGCGDVQTEIISATGSTGGGDNTGGNTGGGDTGNTGGGDAGNAGGGTSGSGSTGDNTGNGNAGTGNIRPEVIIRENVPAAAFATPAGEMAGMLLTEQEQQLAQSGTDIRILLNIEDASERVQEAEKALVGSVLQDWRVGQYLDISLYKLVGEQRTQITTTEGKIRITLAIPESLKQPAGSGEAGGTQPIAYAILRVHDGQVELLPDLDHDADTITVETDRFSTYVLILLDKEAEDAEGAKTQSGEEGNAAGESGAGGDGTGTDGGEGAVPSNRDTEPKTGGFEPVRLYATLAMIAGFTYLLLYFAERRGGMTEKTKKELVSKLIAWAKRGRILRRYAALAAIFMLLVYYHSIGKKAAVEWTEVYGK